MWPAPKPEQATALKAALIAKDPLVKVVIEETAMRQDAPDERVKLADRKIELFNAVEALAAKGVRIAAFTCACPHAWFDELAAEVSIAVVDACGAKGEPLPVEDYAEKLLSTCDALPAKPYKVGLIGGLGPAATVDLYDKIVKATPATTDQEHIRLVVEQNPQIPDRTKALLEGGADPHARTVPLRQGPAGRRLRRSHHPVQYGRTPLCPTCGVTSM